MVLTLDTMNAIDTLKSAQNKGNSKESIRVGGGVGVETILAMYTVILLHQLNL